MKTRWSRVQAKCVCCRGTTSLLVYGPSMWRAEIICHRCNVGTCGKSEHHSLNVDAWLRKYGCRSRDGKPITRYRGHR